MTTTPPLPPRVTLDDRHDRIVAALTRRLAERARRTSAIPATHDFLVVLPHPELLEEPEPPEPWGRLS